MSSADYWDDVLKNWRPRRGVLLRAYSDAANRRLLERWLPRRVRRLLKTDLFDEAVAEGLYPFLRSRAETVVGVDISDAVIAAARDRYPDLNAQRADVRKLPFEANSFDVVVSNSTLDHFDALEHLEAAVRELHRVLAPEGTLVITLDNELNPLVAVRNALPQGLLRRIGLVPYVVGTSCGPRRLRRILVASGFDVAEMDAMMHVPRTVALALAPLLGARAESLLLAAEKLDRLPTRFLTGQFVAARALGR